jgi:ribosomal protein S18 acetylase RimI-like enzyme
MSEVTIRPATDADVPAVARIWREGWPDGHEGHVPAELAAERTPASFDRSRRGGGVAERLLRHAEAVIGQGGRRTAWLAVVAGNVRARRFYARLGSRDQGPFIYQAQTATGTVAVPPTDTNAR